MAKKKKEFKDLFDNDDEKVAMTAQFQKEAKENFGISDFFIQDGKMFLKDGGKNWGENFGLGMFVSGWFRVGQYSYRAATGIELKIWEALERMKGLKRKVESRHVCGLTGFNQMLGDRCDGCES